MLSEDLLLSSYDYLLPDSLIAQTPAIPAHSAKMMVCTPNRNWSYSFEHKTFSDLSENLDDNYLLFLNRTKVFKARIPLHWVKIIRKTWKEVILDNGEIFVYRIISDSEFECLVSDSKNFKPWSKVFFGTNTILESKEFTENGILFSIFWESIFKFLEKLWEMPLPPYIVYKKEKEQWYQTFFAEEIGSSAAPTASLHFTPELVKKLEEKEVNFKYLCLHVGLWTFKPLYEEHIEKQKLHFEPMIVPNTVWEEIMVAKKKKKIFLPVGTTMIRYLESLPYIWKFLQKNKRIQNLAWEVLDRRTNLTKNISIKTVNEFIPEQDVIVHNNNLIIQTRLFIRPWISFYLVDQLITNFHLPKSSLMMLISAFMGRKNLIECYQKAIENTYHFYSFWDGMRVRGPKSLA